MVLAKILAIFWGLLRMLACFNVVRAIRFFWLNCLGEKVSLKIGISIGVVLS